MPPRAAKSKAEPKLKVGDACPDFELEREDETKVKLSDVWQTSGVVIFMYPKVRAALSVCAFLTSRCLLL
jgi:peroxiredoxin